MDQNLDIAELTVQIVSGYVTNNPVRGSELPAVIREVHRALVASPRANTEKPSAELVPAISIRASVQSDAISCLECGKEFKSIKRHLLTAHSLTPEEYRVRWNLSWDYSLVAPNYKALRSALAKKADLGRKHNHSWITGLLSQPAIDHHPTSTVDDPRIHRKIDQ